MWGVAPGAKLIPVRVSTSVVLVGGGVLNLARAIEFAADRNVHVISISRGRARTQPQRGPRRQGTKLRVRCAALNRMTALGTP